MADRLAPVRAVLVDAIERGVARGFLVAIADAENGPQALAVGLDGSGRPLEDDSLVPVTGISNLAVSLAILSRVDRNELRLDVPLATYLPAACAVNPGVTLRTLLAHTSGLPNDVDSRSAPYRLGLDWPTLRDACMATPLVAEPGAQAVYSSVGVGLLATVVEYKTGHRFVEIVRRDVLSRLGIEAYYGAGLPRPAAVVAGNFGPHQGTELEPYNTPFWRNMTLPWCGLVTTISGALLLIHAFAGYRQLVSPALLAEARRDQTNGLPAAYSRLARWSRGAWGLGVELRGAKEPHWTPVTMPADSFGHAGCSGCVAWHDPGTGTSWALHGLRTIDDGWLLREGPRLAQVLLG